MEPKKIYGILSIILGLLFLIFPIFGTVALSTVVGLTFVFFGIAIALSEFSAFNIIVGILSVLVGLVFIFNIGALSFILGFQFYVIGIVLLLAGISGLISSTQPSKIASIVIIILGILSFVLGGMSFDQPLFAAILLGVSLIVEGINIYLY